MLVVAHKLISKAEGATRRLSDVHPRPARARARRAAGGKDPRHVQVVLDETREVRRAEHGVLISVTHHGFVCANAGVDASNAAEDDTVIMLPLDPDASARRLRAGLRELHRIAARRRDHRLLRPRLAHRPVRRRDRLRGPCSRSTTGAGAPTAADAS